MALTQSTRRVISNLLGLAVLRGADLLIPLILLPHLIKTIGLEGYGTFSIVLAFSLYVGALVQYGFNVTAPRDMARVLGDRRKMSAMFLATMLAHCVLAGIGVAISGAVIFLVPALREQWHLYALAIAYTLLRVTFPAWFFQVVGGMREVALFGVLTRTALVAAVLCLVDGKDDVGLLLEIYAASSMVILVYGLAKAKKYLGSLLAPVRATTVLEVLKSGRHAFQSQLAPTLYNSSTTLILGSVGGEAVVGVMASAQKFIDVLGSGAAILASAFLPSISQDIRIHDKFGPAMISTGVLLTIACIFSADLMTEFLYRGNATNVAIVVQFLALSLVGMFVFSAYNQSYLMIVGEERLAKWIVTIVSLSFLLVAAFVIPAFGLAGAIAVLVFARTFLGLASYVAARRIKVSVA